MSVTVTRTKIRVPRRRDSLLTRNRLIADLGDILDYPFTLISAPAGYGKTSLMIDLAHQAAYPICWYSLDPLDKDLQRFLSHFIHAIKVQYPECGEGFLSLLENLPNPAEDIDQLVATLINDLYQSIQEHFVIFLDDFHLVENRPVIGHFISQLGLKMDDNVHLVIASRKLISLPQLALLIGRREVKGIDLSDLAFTTEEINIYLKNSLDQTITQDQVKELWENTEGWITGLLLIAHQDWIQSNTLSKAVKVTGANIADYFSTQVLETVSPQIRELMIPAALLDEFNAEACHQVFGDPPALSWTEFIDTLQDNNLFVELIEDQQPWLRFHQLFREYLLDQFEKLEQDCQQELLTKIMCWHVDQGEWEKAFDFAQKLEEPPVLAEIILQASSSLFHAGRINLLAEWLELLPEDEYQNNPYLQSLKGFIFTELGCPETAIIYLDKSIKEKSLFIKTDNLIQSYIWASTARRLIGKYENALDNAATAYELSESVEINPRVKAEATRELGLSNARLGNNKTALSYLLKSKKIYEDQRKIINSAQVQMDIGYIQLNTGNLYGAKINFESAFSIWNSINNYFQLSLTLNNLGYLSMIKGKYEESYDLLNQSLGYAKSVSNKRLQAFSIGSIGDLAKSLLILNLSLSQYKKAKSLSLETKDKFLTSYFSILIASVYREIGKLDISKSLLESVKIEIDLCNSSFETGLWHLEKGFLNLAMNVPEDASRHFSEAVAIFQKSQRPFELARAQLGQLLQTLPAKNSEKMAHCISRLEKTLLKVETFQPLLPELIHSLEQLREIAQEVPDCQLIRNLIDQTEYQLAALPKLQQQVFPIQAPNVNPDHLTIQALGSTQVLKGGQKITASEWIHQKTVRELLFFLLSQQRSVTKEQVGLAFWPDSSPDLLSCQFKNAVYRLRRALGKEAVIYDRESRRYYFNRELDYSYDVELFLGMLQQARSEVHPDRQIDLYRKAVALYQHPFAPELEGVWAVPLRQELYINYEKSMLLIAKYDLNKGNYSICIKTCSDLLQLEPCLEEAIKLSMKAYSKLGDRTSIKRLFDDCQFNFNNYLDSDPPKSLASLFEILSNKQDE